MRQMLKKTAKYYRLRYIFIDLGPTGSPGNCSIFFSSDAFFVPLNADHFSKMSVFSLSKVLGRWHSDWNGLLSKGWIRNTPKFLGVTFTRVPTHKKNEIVKVNKIFLEETLEAVRETLIPKLASFGMVLNSMSIELGIIPKMTKVLEIAQRCKCAVFELPDDAMDVNSQGNLVQLSKKKLVEQQNIGKKYRTCFQKITQSINRLSRDLDKEIASVESCLFKQVNSSGSEEELELLEQGLEILKKLTRKKRKKVNMGSRKKRRALIL